MYWTEETEQEHKAEVPEDVVDLVYKIECACVPNDHAWELHRALLELMPWLADDPRSGIHLIHGAESMNGWNRPDEPDALIHLSKRSKMKLRVPAERVEDAQAIAGNAIEIAGNYLKIKSASIKPFSFHDVQFARHVIEDAGMTEDDFLEYAVIELKKLNIRPKKLLSGKSQVFAVPDGDITTRSLLVADLEQTEAIRLQEEGIGDGRLLGCGLFVPYKGIKAVKD